MAEPTFFKIGTSFIAPLILLFCTTFSVWANESSDEDVLVIYSKARPVEAIDRRDWFVGEEGHDKAISVQRVTGEPMVLYFYTTWCKFCTSFNKRVINSDQFELAFKNTLMVSINAEAHPSLSEKYDVHGYPIFYVVKSNGDRRKLDTHLEVEGIIATCEALGVPIHKVVAPGSKELAE